ncbi:hypothetical protein Rxycam_00007 [Rubrobacter xylanophilus DSM 9941]|nr:hypothetical protein Rxycam_00007 [Rubrobacter xylanophilus DSM 9941]
METLSVMRGWGMRRYAIAAAAAGLWLVLSGVPTDIIDTPLFVRMTPVVWWDYPFWVAAAALAGLVAATYAPGPGTGGSGVSQEKKVLGGGLLSVFAVGCPVCNKLVVLALGTSGAFAYFAPVQPLLGFLSIGLLAYALRARLAATRACAVAAPAVQNEAGGKP